VRDDVQGALDAGLMAILVQTGLCCRVSNAKYPSVKTENFTLMNDNIVRKFLLNGNSVSLHRN